MPGRTLNLASDETRRASLAVRPQPQARKHQADQIATRSTLTLLKIFSGLFQRVVRISLKTKHDCDERD
jgi:hypothetical protein